MTPGPVSGHFLLSDNRVFSQCPETQSLTWTNLNGTRVTFCRRAVPTFLVKTDA